MNQYLTFTLEEELFALDIGKVREVLDATTVTRVPGTPAFVRGVINLRGNVVPVVDMRRKLGMQDAEQGFNSCIIIVDLEVDGEATILGALADSVQEVLDMDDAQIEPAPRIGSRMDVEYLRGMGKRDDGFIMILDIDRVFSATELGSLRHSAPDEDVAAVA